MTEYDLGQVVGADGQDGADGDDGSTIWNTSTAPSYANSKYTFTISNLTGRTGFEIAVDDIIFYDTYYYIVSTVNTTTVDCTVRVNIKGSTGNTGATGNGISSISKTGTSGLVDTYTISYTNGGSDTFTVTNGSDASVTIVTSFSSTTSDSKVPSEKLVKTELDKKIATSSTSGLVKNDGTIDTNTYLTSASLSGYQTTSNLVTSFSSTTSDSKYPSEKLVKTELDKKIATSSTTGLVKNDGTIDTNSYITSSSLPTKTSDLTNDGSSSSDSLVYVETSATSGLLKNDGSVDTTSYSTFSGSYSDLSNKPSIPSSSSDLSDGSDLIKKSNTSGLLKNDGTVDTSAYITSSALSGYQTTSNLVTSFSSTTSDSKYPSEKLVKTELDKKIGTSSTSGLVKNDGTIDTSSYITSSAISGKEDTSNRVSSWSSTTTDGHYPSEKLVKDSLDGKQATLVSGTNIKTINNETLLGSGNITIQGGGGDSLVCVDDFDVDDTDLSNVTLDLTACNSLDVVTSWEVTPSDSKVPSEKLVKDYVDTLVGNAIIYINGSGS